MYGLISDDKLFLGRCSITALFLCCHVGLQDYYVQKLGSSGQQNATRCGLWWIEMLKARDLYKEAAPIYFRICGEVVHFFGL